MNNFELAARQRRRDAIWLGAGTCAAVLLIICLSGYLINQFVCGPQLSCPLW